MNIHEAIELHEQTTKRADLLRAGWRAIKCDKCDGTGLIQPQDRSGETVLANCWTCAATGEVWEAPDNRIA